MKKKLIIIIAAVILIFGLLTIAVGLKLTSDIREVDKIVRNMSMDEKIGQLLLIEFRSWKTADMEEAGDMEVLNEEVASIISDYHLGNIILFGENTKDTAKTTALIYEMQSTAISSGNLPLLIGIDQEGGNVTRLGQGTCMPGNMAIGVTGNTEYAYENGRVIGSELKAIGMNCDFAPDADVNDNPDNPVIGLRSFGDNPELVSKMVVQMMNGIRKEGVISCAKHFPGHGNTSSDTHTGLAIVNKTKDEWETCEKLPFEAAIDNSIDMIMTAHIQYPKLDDTMVTSKLDGEQIYLPSTLSKKIVTGILRNEMKYDGVIVTDALDMQAISDNFGEQEAVVMAIEAGVDLMCNPVTMREISDKTKLDELYSYIKNAVESGRISENRIDESVTRILIMKQKYGILDEKQYKSSLEEKKENAVSVVGCEEHRVIEEKIAKSSITLANGDDFKPFNPSKKDKVFVYMAYESECNSVQYAIERMKKNDIIENFEIEYASYEKAEEIDDDTKKKLKDADYVILERTLSGSGITDASYWTNIIPIEAIEILKGKEKNTAILATRLPYQLDTYSNFTCFICYNGSGMTKEDALDGTFTSKYGPSIPAATEKIFGQ